jgi:16S rRNA processing protein RimM
VAADGGVPDARAWLRAGVVGAPHGLDGSFHVSRGNPALLVAGDIVMLAGEQRSITRRAGDERRIILRLEGFDDRDAAASLRGSELLVARAGAPALEQDEWWAEDLEGCQVRDGEREVGSVKRLLALPSCEVLEVARRGLPDLLVPLVGDAVRSVDAEQGVIEIDLEFLGER